MKAAAAIPRGNFIPVLSLCASCIIATLCPSRAVAVVDTTEQLKSVTRSARIGNIDGIAALKDLHDSKSAETVVALIDDKRVPDTVKEAIAAIVSAWPEKDGLDFFSKLLRRRTPLDDSLLRFYADLGRAEFKPMFLEMAAVAAAKKDAKIADPVRFSIALRALGRFRDHTDGAVTFITSLLAERHPHVIRDGAADALGGIKHRAALAALVTQPGDPAIGATVQRSLFRLSGQDFGDELDKWSKWFTAEGAQAELKMLPRTDWEQHLVAKAAAPPPENKPFGGGFYGLEVKGRHTLFILDCSGSMHGERMDTLKSEMTNLLESLRTKPKSLHIGILTFNTNFQSCFPGRGLQENKDTTIKKGAQFVSAMQATGNTAMVAVLKHTLAHILPAGDVDTIYFLSDGEPSDGRAEDVMALVLRMFYDHHIKINTIGIGEAAPVEPAKSAAPKETLLQQMARRTGGMYLAR